MSYNGKNIQLLRKLHIMELALLIVVDPVHNRDLLLGSFCVFPKVVNTPGAGCLIVETPKKMVDLGVAPF